MNRRLLFLLVSALCLLLVTTTLYLGRDHLTQLPALRLPFPHKATPSTSSTSNSEQIVATPTSLFAASTTASVTASATASSTAITISNGTVLSGQRIAPYIAAILDPAVTEPPRLGCPALNISRYDVLLQDQDPRRNTEDPQHIDYYFAIDLRNCLALLPRLLGSIVEVVRFLGPERCALSIIEGNSPDGTADVLTAIGPFLDRLNLTYFYNSSDINPAKGDRIHKLAALRNLALQPMFDNLDRVSENTTVLFLNDVAACPEDLLELALQRRALGADMTCAMDWIYVGNDPTFYDVWVARTLAGDSFFEIPPDGNWNSAWNLFWNAPDTKSRYYDNLPFQVFSCWNGATAIGAAPLLEGLRFREKHGGKDGECAQGEPQIFCKEMWFRGYRKIAVVPTVNLEYSDDKAEQIKRLKGFTSDLARSPEEDNRINWVLEPPEKVKCMPTWDNQFWRPWNETLRL
ncbi:hypothetical protein G7Z17_g7612 [Cylindrodendrum hubeiense]|uniref:Alpha-1,3-mannosyltransferase CMT1 n=1 Tax=Cylindrodendrum hubeiense TaxID=595255 RepID=A0A9P5LE20_9HYPO|nr:hypothetical protein G7Z17_g7612 [Cylindrodendrum hubeiense]